MYDSQDQDIGHMDGRRYHKMLVSPFDRIIVPPMKSHNFIFIQNETIMCNKAVCFSSSLDLSNQTTKDWHLKCVKERPSIDESSKQLIESALEAVFDEQIDQWATGESNPERMATVYRQRTASSQVKAIVHGLKLQKEAEAALCTIEQS